MNKPMPGLEGIFSSTGLDAMGSTGAFNTEARFGLGDFALGQEAKARIAEYRRKTMGKQAALNASSSVWDGAFSMVGDLASAGIGAAGRSAAARKAATGTTASNLAKYAPLS